MLEGVALVILFEKVWSVNVLDAFPGVIAFGVAFPFHEVLERSRLSVSSVVHQVFYLILFGSLDEIGWRSGEIGAMDSVFLIGKQERGVEHIVDGP